MASLKTDPPDPITRPAKLLTEDKVILIRVARAFREGMSDADLYEITRGWWVLGKRREGAEHAFAVYRGIVRAVYAIDGWEMPTPELIEEDSTREGRWGFSGRRDLAQEARFLFTGVSGVFPKGAQNPIRYINC